MSLQLHLVDQLQKMLLDDKLQVVIKSDVRELLSKINKSSKRKARTQNRFKNALRCFSRNVEHRLNLHYLGVKLHLFIFI